MQIRELKQAPSCTLLPQLISIKENGARGRCEKKVTRHAVYLALQVCTIIHFIVTFCMYALHCLLLAYCRMRCFICLQNTHIYFMNTTLNTRNITVLQRMKLCILQGRRNFGKNEQQLQQQPMQNCINQEAPKVFSCMHLQQPISFHQRKRVVYLRSRLTSVRFVINGTKLFSLKKPSSYVTHTFCIRQNIGLLLLSVNTD